ncbi:hypothetical protein LZ32DRAFT_609611 [Colletotrichum eremochloae]|nr:hypothetical protein LZ32DRAFT_609611 [Colletotrichum eremochloae]
MAVLGAMAILGATATLGALVATAVTVPAAVTATALAAATAAAAWMTVSTAAPASSNGYYAAAATKVPGAAIALVGVIKVIKRDEPVPSVPALMSA